MTGLLAIFAVLARAAADGESFAWDQVLFRRIYSGASEWPRGTTSGRDNALLDALLPLLYRGADARALGAVAVAVVVALVVLRRYGAIAFYVAVIAVAALSAPLKDAFDRPAPFPISGHPSFPSGHAMASMCIAAGAVALFAHARLVWLVVALAFALVCGVGIAVIADGGHWPSDVLAGWCLSLAWLLILVGLLGERLGATTRRVSVPHPGPEGYMRS